MRECDEGVCTGDWLQEKAVDAGWSLSPFPTNINGEQIYLNAEVLELFYYCACQEYFHIYVSVSYMLFAVWCRYT